MTHFSNHLDTSWAKFLSIREVTLVEEFSTIFDRNQFFNEVKESSKN